MPCARIETNIRRKWLAVLLSDYEMPVAKPSYSPLGEEKLGRVLMGCSRAPALQALKPYQSRIIIYTAGQFSSVKQLEMIYPTNVWLLAG